MRLVLPLLRKRQAVPNRQVTHIPEQITIRLLLVEVAAIQPALSVKMNQKDSSKSEVHSSSASQTQEMQSTSKRGIVDKKSVSKQPQSEKQNPQRPIVDKAQDKQESKDKERQGSGSATKRAAQVHERPATTPVPTKSDTKATASKQEQNVKERPATVTKEQPQSSKTKEPVTKPQENVRTQVVRESPSDR